MVQSKFSYEMTFWFISIENDGKQKSKKNTLRVFVCLAALRPSQQLWSLQGSEFT